MLFVRNYLNPGYLCRAEFNDDGNLVYSPPPLDEIWLTEPEHRERKQRLRDQRLRNQEIMRETAKSIPTTSPDQSSSRDVPPLAEISDDERSVGSASLSQNRDEEPEGDGWQPQQDLIDNDELIPLQPPSPPSAGNENLIPDDDSSEDESQSIDSEGRVVQPTRHRCWRRLRRPTSRPT